MCNDGHTKAPIHDLKMILTCVNQTSPSHLLAPYQK